MHQAELCITTAAYVSRYTSILDCFAVVEYYILLEQYLLRA
jgi:hypothetical protein